MPPRRTGFCTAAMILWPPFILAAGCAKPLSPCAGPALSQEPSAPSADAVGDAAGSSAAEGPGEAAPPAGSAKNVAPKDDRAPLPPGNRVEYQPGLVMDFARRQVEVECRVVLREGLLELLACAPGTKEHESILVARPRPLHVYQALGLIGLTPGAPAAWDERRQARIPATGDSLTIHIAYEQNGRTVEVEAWAWLKDLSTGEAARPRPWLFAGSLTSPRDGSFAADADGNVISVVDFGTELVGLAEPHSAVNAALWLTAYTERIPPIGTPCTLLLRPAE